MSKFTGESAPSTWVNSTTIPWILLAILSVLFLSFGSFTYWRSSGTGPQVQVPMFYDAHYLFPRPWTQEQSAPGVPPPAPLAFYGENVLSQSFVAGSDNLARVSFTLSGPEDSRALATLTNEDGDIWQAEIAPADDGRSEAYSISFPPIYDSKGQRYTFALSPLPAPAEQPLVSATVGGDRLGYSLRLNDFIRPGNLALTTYSKGTPGLWWVDALAEQLLPPLFRTRLQQYKPPLFKGDLFAWLLLITAGFSAALLVLAYPREAPDQGSPARRLLRVVGWFLVILLGSFLLWQEGSGRAQLFGPANDYAAVAVKAAQDSAPAAVEAVPGSFIQADLISDLWTAVREPEARFVETGIIQGYPAIRVPAGSRLTYALTVPPDGRLRLAAVAEGSGTVDFAALVNNQGLFNAQVKAQSDAFPITLSWQELDLSPWSGQGVVLSLETSSDSGDAEGLWLMPQIITDASWLLPDPPPDDNYLPLGVRYNDAQGGAVELLGAVIEDTDDSDNDLVVRLLWRPLHPSDQYGKLFVHLLDDKDQLLAQHDGPPVNGAYPIPSWRTGKIVLDEHRLSLDSRTRTPGPYRLEIGIYDPHTLQRWTAEDAGGRALAQGRAILDLPAEVLP